MDLSSDARCIQLLEKAEEREQAGEQDAEAYIGRNETNGHSDAARRSH